MLSILQRLALVKISVTEQRLILILGDQLTHTIASLNGANKDTDLVVMFELTSEATYVRHHQQKLVLVLSAMRHFALELREAGWQVHYVELSVQDDAGAPAPTNFTEAVTALLAEPLTKSVSEIVLTEPGEWRLRQEFDQWSDKFSLPVHILADERFLCSRSEFANWADGRKQLRMEYFYREMRKKTGLLMAGDKPEGDKWNFDADNRKPAKADLFMPSRWQCEADTITGQVIELVQQRFGQHFGDLNGFCYAVDRAGALMALDHFLAAALANFGDFQDAMLEGEPFLYHSLLSPYINLGLLDPLEVCQRVEEEYRDGHVPLNAAEGFIRQIIGWREYVRGVYWLKMPEYVHLNYFSADRPLPDFYWTGDSEMACMRAAITQTKEHGYAHHIQRLMVTGNFALLAGIDPVALHEWYLQVYVDAYEWVELPNTLGMSQFADGGLLGSKPYVASGNYINKMSNYCGNCRYSVKQKTGPDACPLNSLYWDFLARNEKLLAKNPRMGQTYATWRRMSDAKRQDYLDSAAVYLTSL